MFPGSITATKSITKRNRHSYGTKYKPEGEFYDLVCNSHGTKCYGNKQCQRGPTYDSGNKGITAWTGHGMINKQGDIITYCQDDQTKDDLSGYFQDLI